MPLLPQTPRLSQSDAFLVPAAAAVVGFCTFALSAGLGIANPTAIDWVFIGDPETHFLGWHLFRRAPWTPQIGWNPLLMWPIGTSIGLTDAIPLMALIFKPLSSILPADFQYQGLWLLGSFVLHGVFAALLMRVVTPRKELQLLGACLIVMSPPMLYRYSHEALAAHWQILWALWLALRYRNAAPFIPWLLLALISAATHPYLSMMVGALLVAAHARDILQLPAMWWKPAVRLTAITACVAIVLWQCGYFVVSGSDLQGEKFGYYSMNLLSPFLPASVYAAADGPFKPRHEQYEGFAYLGAGLITLGVVAVVALLQRPSRPWRPDWRHQLPFGAALATLLALAIGPIVAIGPHVLFEYNPQWWGPLTLFRASGRMAWPIYYAGVVGVLAAVTRLRSGWPLFAMSVALLLQAWDVSGHYRVLRQMRNVTLGKPLQSRFWDAAPRHYQRLIVFPSRMCTAEETFDFRPFAVLAAVRGWPSTRARPPVGICRSWMRTVVRWTRRSTTERWIALHCTCSVAI